MDNFNFAALNSLLIKAIVIQNTILLIHHFVGTNSNLQQIQICSRFYIQSWQNHKIKYPRTSRLPQIHINYYPRKKNPQYLEYRVSFGIYTRKKVLLKYCYMKMKSSQIGSWNHFYCRKFLLPILNSFINISYIDQIDNSISEID